MLIVYFEDLIDRSKDYLVQPEFEKVVNWRVFLKQQNEQIASEISIVNLTFLSDGFAGNFQQINTDVNNSLNEIIKFKKANNMAPLVPVIVGEIIKKVFRRDKKRDNKNLKYQLTHYIHQLQSDSQSFKNFSHDYEDGYLDACESIKNEVNKIFTN